MAFRLVYARQVPLTKNPQSITGRNPESTPWIPESKAVLNFLSWGDCLVPVHTYPDIFKSATFSFRIQKISTSTRNRIQIEFARPQVSETYPNSLSYSGLF